MFLYVYDTGGIVIRNYATSIFEDSGVSSSGSLLLNVFLGVVKVLATVWSIAYVSDLIYSR